MERMKPRILVVDDEANIRRLILFLLRAYDLYEAPNGQLALECMREVRPDLVLLDVIMPELTGLEVLAAMRADPQLASIPVILLSAKGQQGEVEQGIQSGATRYVVKPFEGQELRACIFEVLQSTVHARTKE